MSFNVWHWSVRTLERAEIIVVSEDVYEHHDTYSEGFWDRKLGASGVCRDQDEVYRLNEITELWLAHRRSHRRAQGQKLRLQ